ncbi:MAG: hypothetical protein RLZZ592_258 [Pseudomonadota bacterium]|jgi:biopolymer transport protein ExbD
MTLPRGPFDAPPDEDAVMATINTTPLVDVMLVLLIIFLITIPVVATSVPVELPKERLQPRETRPDSIVISVDAAGGIFWYDLPLAGPDALKARLLAAVHAAPLGQAPEVQVRGDRRGAFDPVAQVVLACQRAGIARISFITEPQALR